VIRLLGAVSLTRRVVKLHSTIDFGAKHYEYIFIDSGNMEDNTGNVRQVPHPTAIPSYKEIKHIFQDEQTSIQYLIDEGVLQVPFCCETLCRPEGKSLYFLYFYNCTLNPT
jgi:hypothetical protein